MPSNTADTVTVETVTSSSAGFREDFRKTKVENLHSARRRNLHVGWLEIPMNDPLVVRCLERVGDLPGNVQRLIERDRTSLQAIGERLTVNQLHDDGGG